jgi:hypothetical protein
MLKFIINQKNIFHITPRLFALYQSFRKLIAIADKKVIVS